MIAAKQTALNYHPSIFRTCRKPFWGHGLLGPTQLFSGDGGVHPEQVARPHTHTPRGNFGDTNLSMEHVFGQIEVPGENLHIQTPHRKGPSLDMSRSLLTVR